VPPPDDNALRELVRYAVMAASSHNTQPWKFRLSPGRIGVLPDTTRRTPAVDPDDHHLYCSLGCAVENILQAARGLGYVGTARYSASADEVHVDLAAAPPERTPLFDALAERQCTRTDYDGRPLPGAAQAALVEAAQGDGVRAAFFTDPARLATIVELVGEATRVQVNDPAFVVELKRWIRFSDAEAARARDGLYSRAAGNPATPRWLASLMFGAIFNTRSETQKYARQIASSAGVAVFASDEDDRAHWIEAGRAYERFALQATALGIRNAFINQPLEVPRLRTELAARLGLGRRRPDLRVRYGYGPTLPRSLRRPIEDMLLG
jgi:hypothetical protein